MFRSPALSIVLATTAHPAAGSVVLFDFGPDGGNGVPTASPDGSGNAWNNISGPVGTDLVTTSGNATSIDIQFTTNFSANGGPSFGGLMSPDAGLLGELAVGTATGDYFFVSGTGVMTFELRDLDPNASYALDLFGTRATTSTRETLYTVSGGHGVATTSLVTSGENIGADGVYDGNDSSLASLSGLTADGNGAISVSVSASSGGFAYLGVARLTIIPAPGAAALFGAGLVATTRRRR